MTTPAPPPAPKAEQLLRELVACDDLKKEAFKHDSAGTASPFWKLMDEYRRRKPLAWAAARAFLRGSE